MNSEIVRDICKYCGSDDTEVDSDGSYHCYNCDRNFVRLENEQ